MNNNILTNIDTSSLTDPANIDNLISLAVNTLNSNSNPSSSTTDSSYNDALQQYNITLNDDAIAAQNQLIEYFNQQFSLLAIKIDAYNTLTSNLQSNQQLFNSYESNNNQEIKKIEKLEDSVFTNDRKSFYANQSISTIRPYYNLFYYFYYCLVLLYLSVSIIYYRGFSIIESIIFILLIFYPYLVYKGHYNTTVNILYALIIMLFITSTINNTEKSITKKESALFIVLLVYPYMSMYIYNKIVGNK